MSSLPLEFEKPIIELDAKIEELQKFSEEKGIDLTEEIQTLLNKAESLKKEIYGNLTPWQRISVARHSDRPSSADYIRMIFQDFHEMHGDRCYGDDPAVIGGIARFNGQPVTVIGQLKGKDTKQNLILNFGMTHPEGNRKAARLMSQAEKFGRPIFTFVDTPGAFPGIGAEERGQGQAIAASITRMMTLKVPIIVTVTGEGGSGGALAMASGDRILILENAVYSVISPEAFASILWKDASRAQEAASMVKLTSKDLLSLGIVDEIVPEPMGGAHRNHAKMAEMLRQSLQKNFDALTKMNTNEIVEKRYQRFRSIGQFVSG